LFQHSPLLKVRTFMVIGDSSRLPFGVSVRVSMAVLLVDTLSLRFV